MPDTSHDPSDAALRDKAAIILGGLGLVSGVLSALIGFDRQLDSLQTVAGIFFLKGELLPIGIVYAVAIGLSLWLLTHRVGAALVAAIGTLYAWSGAIHIAIRLQRNAGDDAHLLAASLAAGAFGAGLTHLSASFGLPRLCRMSAFGLTIMVGAIFGLLFYFSERGDLDRRVLPLLWQPMVAFVIGLAAAQPTSDPR